MKCSRCGHRANSLPAMGKHYRKAHPGAMRRKVVIPGYPFETKSISQFGVALEQIAAIIKAGGKVVFE